MECFLATGPEVKTEAISRMTELRDEGVAAFVGPDHYCKDAALVASAWNLPMIAFVSCRESARSKDY